jgi:hypothetical protein
MGSLYKDSTGSLVRWLQKRVGQGCLAVGLDDRAENAGETERTARKRAGGLRREISTSVDIPGNYNS